MNLDAIVHGAILGGGIGALTGIVPLVVGYFCREKRKALGGFVGCVLGGAVGGLYAAIAVMAVATGQIVRPPTPLTQRTTQWTGLASYRDKAWYLVAMIVLFICMFGTMFVSAAFLTPLVLGEPNCAPRDATGKIIEPVMLFGGLGVGIVLGFFCVSAICRKYLSSETHANWAMASEATAQNLPVLLQKATRYYYSLLLPRGYKISSANDAGEAQPCGQPGPAAKSAAGRLP